MRSENLTVNKAFSKSSASFVQKVYRVFRQEGGRETGRRILWKFKSLIASIASRFIWNGRTKKIDDHGFLGKTSHGRTQDVYSVDIVICVHNALNDIQSCLDSLERHSEPYTRILLVDDGSLPLTAEFLTSYADKNRLRLLRNDTAKGYTLAANQGLRACSADYVVLLNSDTIVTPGWLTGMLHVLRQDPRIGVVGPLSNTASWQSIPSIEENGDWKSNSIPDGVALDEYARILAHMMPSNYAEVGFVNGFCMLIHRNALEDIGLFDEKTFGRGYGEENDFCLRAYSRGWKLAISLQSYVFHSQSKSYSNERRKQLCEQADRLLDAKHGRNLKHARLAITAGHPLLRYGREASLCISELHSAQVRLRTSHADRSLLFLLPAAHAGGGSNVVISEAKALHEAGVNVWIANLIENRDSFRNSYPELELPCCYFNLADHDQLAWQAKGFDAVVATHNNSAHWAACLPDTRLGYYIQDYEPFFYPAGSKGWYLACDSYRLKAPFHLFCKTQWTAQTLQKEIGISCDVIGPSLDGRRFAPSCLCRHDVSSRPIFVVAMIRVSCKRRNPHLTAKILTSLNQRYGQRVDLYSFGSSDTDLLANGIHSRNVFTNLGMINSSSVAALLQKADIFIDASSFQAMGLTAMEAMASGCAVVGPQLGGLREITGSDGNPLARCVDTSSTDAILDACRLLIEDSNERRRQIDRSFQVTRFHPLLSALRMMDILFDHRSLRHLNSAE